MADFFNTGYINRLFLYFTLIAFNVTYAVPQNYNYVGNLNEVALMVRLEKLVDKLVRSENKSTDTMIKSLVDVKNEIEITYNTHLNTDLYIDEAKRKIGKNNLKDHKEDLDKITKKIKKQERKISNIIFT